MKIKDDLRPGTKLSEIYGKRLTSEQIEAICKDYAGGLTVRGVAKKHGCSHTTVRWWLSKKKIPHHPRNLLVLTEEQRSHLRVLIDGLLLGDGWITNGCLSLAQSSRYPNRIEWLQRVQSELAALGIASSIVKYAPRGVLGFNKNGGPIVDRGMTRLKTLKYGVLEEEYRRWYPLERKFNQSGRRQCRKQKCVPANIALTPLVITYWLAGDGSAQRCAMHFYTNGFRLEDVQWLRFRLKDTYGFESARSDGAREGQYFIRILSQHLADLYMLVSYLLPKCFSHKLRFAKERLLKYSYEEFMNIVGRAAKRDPHFAEHLRHQLLGNEESSA